MYKNIPFFELDINNGFWQQRQKMNAKTTIPQVYKRFEETSRFACIASRWKKPFVRSHIFYDSDTAKWLEAAAYVLHVNRADNTLLERQCDEIIDSFASLQRFDGYLNSDYQRKPWKKKFSRRTDHELYCCGHLCEAAIAYAEATGKRKFLDVTEKYVDYIIKRFVEKQNTGFVTPGHEEIELALLRLYEATGKEKYKNLAEFFLNSRGVAKEKTYKSFLINYDQHDKPIRELDSAQGHAVRALYLYCGMADMARINGDKDVLAACKRLYADILTKMYVTGGIGSSHMGEAFTVPYDLPNMTAYTESCASIALLMFCRRMQKTENDVTYADTIERIMYNNLLSCVSLDGKAFFYENPLEIKLSEFTKNNSVKEKVRLPITQRKEVFSCSCCPPNICRQIASVGDVTYTEDDENIYMQQYIGSTFTRGTESLSVTTNYPADGKIIITAKGVKKNLIVRIPSWCDEYTVSINGEKVSKTVDKGYLNLHISGDFSVILDLHIKPKYYSCSPLSDDNRNAVALCYGPVVYCIEGVDNGDLTALAVDKDAPFRAEKSDFGPLPYLDTTAYRLSSATTYFTGEPEKKPTRIRFIPYYAFANRGESDMKVWVPKL